MIVPIRAAIHDLSLGIVLLRQRLVRPALLQSKQLIVLKRPRLQASNDYAATPIVRQTIVPLRLRSTRQPIDELYARPLSLTAVVPYYYLNRLLLLPACSISDSSVTASCPQYYNRQLLLRLQLSRFNNIRSSRSTSLTLAAPACSITLISTSVLLPTAFH